MTRRRSDIEAENHETEGLAELLEFRLHAIALVLTGIVLAMRLVAGRQDLTPTAESWQNASVDEPGAEAPPSWVRD
jgi:hypothetical protein